MGMEPSSAGGKGALDDQHFVLTGPQVPAAAVGEGSAAVQSLHQVLASD